MSDAETAPVAFIDSHCHVDATEFDEDREEVLQRARDAGVRELIVVGASSSLEQAQATLDFAARHPNMRATVGVHPNNADKLDATWWNALCDLAARPEVVAVGESGLDYYYDAAPRQTQVDRFIDHIDLAVRLGKPIICHIRDAHAEATQIIRDHVQGRVPTIIHCFTGTPEDARNYVALDCYISFSGIVTFKGASARPVREAVACVPHNRLLIETDCPYLAPVPKRGKRNEPAFLVDTAKTVAAESGLTLPELSAITVANTRVVFALTSA